MTHDRRGCGVRPCIGWDCMVLSDGRLSGRGGRLKAALGASRRWRWRAGRVRRRGRVADGSRRAAGDRLAAHGTWTCHESSDTAPCRSCGTARRPRRQRSTDASTRANCRRPSVTTLADLPPTRTHTHCVTDQFAVASAVVCSSLPNYLPVLLLNDAIQLPNT